MAGTAGTDLRIHIFVVTYTNEPLLLRCLDSVAEAQKVAEAASVRVTVLNNFGELALPDRPGVTVVNNAARPDFSTGHLARSWNQAILHGFRDPNDPACDLLVLAQNDSVFQPNFLAAIKRHAARFCYVTFGHGDEVQVMTPEAIRRIGLYDERFCNIGYHEADYFLRALIAAPQAVSINDAHHGRVHNPVANDVTKLVTTGYMRKDPAHIASIAHHGLSRRVFAYKWGKGTDPHLWRDAARSLRVCAKQFMMYPYFEAALPQKEHKYHVV